MAQETAYSDKFKELLEEVKSQNKFDKTTGVLQFLKIREIAGEDDDKREEQFNELINKVSELKETITGIDFSFNVDPMLTVLENQQELLSKSFEELTLIRKISEGSLKYDKDMKAYLNTSGKKVTNQATGKVSADGQAVDYETARDFLSTAPQRIRDDETNRLQLKKVERAAPSKPAQVQAVEKARPAKEPKAIEPREPEGIVETLKEYFGGVGQGIKEQASYIVGDVSKEGLKEKVGSVKQGFNKAKETFGKVKSFMGRDDKGYQIGKTAGSAVNALKEKAVSFGQSVKEVVSAPASYQKSQEVNVTDNQTNVSQSTDVALQQQKQLDIQQEKIATAAKEFESKIEQPKVELDYASKFDETNEILRSNNETLSTEIQKLGTVFKEEISKSTQAIVEGVGASGGGGSIVGDAVDLLGKGKGGVGKSIGSRALGAVKGIGSSALSLGKAALSTTAGATVAAGATMAAVGAGTDYVAGKFGVGKDEKGEDIKIDETKDDANWNKMSFGEKVQSGLARGIEKVGDVAFLGNMSRQARADRIAKESAYFDKKEGKVTPTETVTGESRDPVGAVPKPTGPITVNGKTLNPGDPGYDEAATKFAEIKGRSGQLRRDSAKREWEKLSPEEKVKMEGLTRGSDKDLSKKIQQFDEPAITPTGTIPTAAATTNLTAENQDLNRTASSAASPTIVNNVNNVSGGNQAPQMVPIKNKPRNDHSTFERQQDRVAFY